MEVGSGPGLGETERSWTMWITPIVIERPGGRVRLEPMAERHAPGLFAAIDHDDVWRLRPDPRVRRVEEMPVWIATRVANAADGKWIPFVIVIAASGEIAGTTSYLEVQEENRALEIGATIVSPKWQRTFVNTECKLTLMEHAFEKLPGGGAVRVQFKVDTRNERSLLAVERLGAVREGTLRKNRICHDGYIRDTAVFSIVAAEWAGVKGRLEGEAMKRRSDGATEGNAKK